MAWRLVAMVIGGVVVEVVYGLVRQRRLVGATENIKETKPRKATIGSAGYDLCSTETTTIEPNNVQKVGTGIKLQMPQKFYIQICSRSSLAVQKMNEVGGIIDNDYRGEIFVLLQNTGTIPFEIEEGQKIAQLLIKRAYYLEFQEENSLEQTETLGKESSGL